MNKPTEFRFADAANRTGGHTPAKRGTTQPARNNKKLAPRCQLETTISSGKEIASSFRHQGMEEAQGFSTLAK
jgi:hypothetical protein